MGDNARRAIGPVLALLVGVLGCVLLALWSGSLPDPIATHFGPDGPDGFTSIGGTMAVIAVSAVIGAAVSGAAAYFARETFTSRVMSAMGAGTVAFIVGIMLGFTIGQRGLADAAEASPSLGWPLLLGVLFAVPVAGAVYTVTPPWPTDFSRPVGEVPMDTEGRAEWSGKASAGPSLLVTVAISVAVLCGVGVMMASWYLLGMAVLVALVALGVSGSVRVEVSAEGYHARGSLGWPVIDMPLSDIRRAEVVEVNALRDFGGWGFRVTGRRDLRGARGFVLRSGEALLVVGDERREVVVIEGATEAAGVLNALVARR
ncbi:DUF1648 domain-containing protein [Gordonia sp. (in: high G+C Gram-positive bacteria)]|uniref:DUF1648 domain-containing protein n=1 Tax=Gordonia sp. (in: high G+C Gram-positive bacteria) TaxID=84139 RepID=UPI0016B50306|nr:DUF1648 domain-containing protein [Gordonia sp. (in: high G+C Gram-positive bacteria)]NLG46705.1 DUF1648 domain-containing protein [Gordonia sp. (in: high G+C Gram-positive bacteria)]